MNAAVTMQTRVEDYLAERRRLGSHLHSTGSALKSFARYADGLDLSTALTAEVMAAWARQAKTNSDDPTTWARRLKQLRPFARWLQQLDPDTEVPDSTLFGRIGWRPAPHIFTEQEIGDLLAAARRLEPDLRGATYEALFGVLAATGLRVCEAVHLRQVDRIFQRLRERLGWVNRGSHAAIRVHDLRHSCIVRRLVRWHAQGVDIDQAMLALSTYVGHARVSNTYWYLSGVPELMGLAAERFVPPMQDTEVNHV
ncbi:MAG: hypothetical protein P8Y78_13530 [Acidihalobacter sp.]|jgi:integrase